MHVHYLIAEYFYTWVVPPPPPAPSSVVEHEAVPTFIQFVVTQELQMFINIKGFD